MFSETAAAGVLSVCVFVPLQRGTKCKNTWRQKTPDRFTYDGCYSVKKYKPKYCSTCKRRRCCHPDKSKTLSLEWECEDGKIVQHKLMWIKSCSCTDEC